jgi:hypothetical protein
MGRGLLVCDGDEAYSRGGEKIKRVHEGASNDAEYVAYSLGNQRFDERFRWCHARHTVPPRFTMFSVVSSPSGPY